MDALKLCPLSYLTVCLLVLVNIQDGAEAVICYQCQHILGVEEDAACVDGTTSEIKEPCQSCKTEWSRNTATNLMDFVIRDCASSDDKTDCATTGGRESCVYVCNGDLCNTDVYIPPTTTPGTTTTGHPKHCFACSYNPPKDSAHCLIVNAKTRESEPCDNGCEMYVRFDPKDHSVVKDMVRGCNGGDDVKSFCRASGDDYNCFTYCLGHMCNHDDYSVKPDDPNDGGNGGSGNGQMGTTQTSSFYALTLVLLLSLLLTL